MKPWISLRSGMNSVAELRDYRIADEIQRIQSLSREQLIRELVSLRASFIEGLSDEQIINYGQIKSKN